MKGARMQRGWKDAVERMIKVEMVDSDDPAILAFNYSQWRFVATPPWYLAKYGRYYLQLTDDEGEEDSNEEGEGSEEEGSEEEGSEGESEEASK